jgi:hypothetical protein
MKVDYKKRYEEAIAKLNDDAQAYITELGKQRDSAERNFEIAKNTIASLRKQIACQDDVIVKLNNSLELAKVIETGLRKALEQQANVIEGLRYDIVTISEVWQCDVLEVEGERDRFIALCSEANTSLGKARNKIGHQQAVFAFFVWASILTLAVVALVSSM